MTTTLFFLLKASMVQVRGEDDYFDEFSQRLGSKGLWFNPHPRHVVASLDKTLYDSYLFLVELKQAAD